MKPEVSKNEMLDRVTAVVLKSGALRRDEIEQIASGKRLFSDIQRRIARESSETNPTIGAVILRPRRLALASLAAVILITAVFVIGSIIPRRASTLQAHQNETKSAPDRIVDRQIETPVQTDHNKYIPLVETAPKARPAAPRTTEARYVRRAEKQEEQPVELYALADMSSVEPAPGSRVIRVELPRASLVSLGVDVPLDGDKQLIKTDLLIGPDGVPRAIRVVDKFENF